MKLTLFLLGLVALATALPANNEDDKESNVFVRTFNVLHQEPPPPMIQSRATAETKRITQKVDNFDESDTRTWEMRYMENAEFYQPGGPLFIFVGGEWEITSGRVTGGHMYDMAKEHNGYLFYTEHRFYGDSKPLSDLSTENLRYLNVRQALADLAHFIRTMKSTINGMANSKVIIVGGSYSATMVTWFKREYPDLATGAWASSAPLLAKVNFVEYKEVTGESIRKVGGPACYERIHNAMTELETMFAHKQGAEVKAMLKLCSPFDENSELDLWNLFSEISDVFAGVVQTHNNGNIQGVCREILMEDSDVLGLAKYLLRKWNNPTGCNDLSYGTMLKTLRNTAYTKNIMRQWIYQTCNEYGWYQTSDSKDQPFGSSFPVEFYLQMCRDVYGDQFTSYFVHDQVVATNDHFGALKPDVKNVYITHGQLDPWSAMGIQEGELTTIIPNHAHCKDFDSISANDSWEMRQSKERIAKLVREWLAEP